jgi:MoaA/NifB/PqqE/SkfB family radical SAM enzyme
MGREVQATLDSIAASPRTRDHNPLLETVIKRPVADQSRIMSKHPDILRLPLLLLENRCCHDCIFCRSKELDPTPLEPVHRWLEGNEAIGLDRLGIVGNEPLSHPHIVPIIEKAREHGFTRFDVLTTGHPLSDPSFAKDLFDLGVTGYSLPLWAADAATHDAITRSRGSHADTLSAIETLESLGATIHVHANLLAQNVDRIQKLERFVTRTLDLPFCIIPVRPKDANLPYSRVAPRYSDLLDQGPLRSLVALPLCVVSRVQDPPVPPPDIISDVLKIYVLDQPFVKPPRCASCSLRGKCAGTFQAYLDLHGDSDLDPLP